MRKDYIKLKISVTDDDYEDIAASKLPARVKAKFEKELAELFDDSMIEISSEDKSVKLSYTTEIDYQDWIYVSMTLNSENAGEDFSSLLGDVTNEYREAEFEIEGGSRYYIFVVESVQ